MRKKLSFLFFGILFCTFMGFAQNPVKGVIVDADTKETLIGVNIYSESEQVGASTDLDGSFSLKLKGLKGQLRISYVGYKTMHVDVDSDLSKILLESDVIGLTDVIITSSMAVRRKTPVALFVIDTELLEAKMSSQEFPEILKSTPGVYVTKVGGGYGDSEIRMRGFTSENIAIMINGVPTNDMEWGGVYWSNHTGLTGVTRTMQVQRGLGANKVAAPSIGGSINIVTKSTDAKKGGSLSYMMGNDSFNKLAFDVSTGLTKDGWALTAMGSKTWGDGYIVGTDFEDYGWFLSLSKVLGDRHQLSFTAFGSSQTHNQRNKNDKMRVGEWQRVNADGMDKYKFNATFGYDENGNVVNGNRNTFHKPQLSLNHIWEISNKSSLSTALYMSLGDGGGRRFRGTNQNNLYGVSNTTGLMNDNFQLVDGSMVNLRQKNTLYRDYSIVQQNNRTSINGSQDVISESVNNHVWTGLLSSFTTQFGENIDFYGGLDLRYYKGDHKEKIKDLLGGEFYIDTEYRKDHREFTGAELDAWKSEKLYPGDYIYRDNTGYIVQTGVFAQAEYNKDALSSFVSGSLSNSRYWKRDRYYYDNTKSDAKNFIGYNIKGGANYNIDENHNVFVNAGYLSRAPYMRSYFARMDQNNAVNKDAENEKSYSFELGYGFRSRIFTANLNLYYTKWLDKTMVRRFDDMAYLNLKGVDARHQGIELDFAVKPFKNLELTGMISIGDWIWDSKATGKVYDDHGDQINNQGKPIFPNGTGGMTPEQIEAESNNHVAVLDLKDVRVGNSAQTTMAFGGSYKLLDNNLTIGLDYNFYGRNYADYYIAVPYLGTEANASKYHTPWRIPSAGIFDLRANYKFDIAGMKTTVYGNVNNMFNTEYITDASDYNSLAGGGSWNDVGVFYGFGRTFTISMKIQF